MAVIQYFTIELPISVKVDLAGGVEDEDGCAADLLTLSREDAESLCNDLVEALHPEGVAAPQVDTEAVLAAFLAQVNGDAAVYQHEEQPTGRMMSPDEALARVQAMETAVSSPAAVRNPGTGIGNG